MLEGLLDPRRWALTFENMGPFWEGFGVTLKVVAAGLALALLLGTLLGVFSTTRSRILRGISRVYVEFYQNTPLPVQVLFMYMAGPQFLQVMTGAAQPVRIAPFALGALGVGLYHAAYVAEVIRTGIEAVPRGQMEAAQSQGFSRLQTYAYIVLPQTFKIILPPLCNQALNLVKNTSVLALVAGGDLMYRSDNFVSLYGFLQGYIVCCLMYFIICFPIAMLGQWLERRSKARPRAKVIPGVTDVKAIAAGENAKVLVISAKIEEDIAQMDDEEKNMFLEEMGIGKSGLDRLIAECYDLLGLISFLTAGADECRAWTIRKGTKAPQAAGKIHSDFERGFIRAEIVSFNDLKANGSMTACKEKGLVRSEGKDYVMQDGDVTLFRFNV